MLIIQQIRTFIISSIRCNDFFLNIKSVFYMRPELIFTRNEILFRHEKISCWHKSWVRAKSSENHFCFDLFIFWSLIFWSLFLWNIRKYSHEIFTLRKIPQFQLISWCGNFAERHSFHIVSGDSLKTMRKLCLSAKFSHQKIRLNYGIFRNGRCFLFGDFILG